MTCGISIFSKILKINYMQIDQVKYVPDTAVMNGEEYRHDRIELHDRPFKRIRQQCPVCRKRCGIYDHQARHKSTWRANSFNGVPVEIKYTPVRINCPKHGVLNEYMPWVDGSSRFTADFNNEASFLALNCPKTVVSEYLGINWRTVGNCIKAAHDRLEPDPGQRLRGLKWICVDKTSYRKGHKYITVVYDLDRNRVVWCHPNHGYEVFRQFCEMLTEEEQKAIEVVAGDGAKWIDQCTAKYFVNARRCVDFFHVVGWINEALDKVRNQTRSQAEHELERMKKEFAEAEAAEKEEISRLKQELEKARQELKEMPSRGRPGKRKTELKEYILILEDKLASFETASAPPISEEEYQAAVKELETLPKRGRRSKRKAQLLVTVSLYENTLNNGNASSLAAVHQKIINELEEKAKAIKDTKYALGMNPENLRESQQDKLKLLEETHPDVYRAYQLKEQLRIILHMKDLQTSADSLDRWIETALNCGMNAFKALADKIIRHRQNILNSVELQVNSSRSEATNTTIKSLIATARGFRNLENMFALIYLRCSDINIPLNNRYHLSPEKQQELREIQNARKHLREEKKRAAALAF